MVRINTIEAIADKSGLLSNIVEISVVDVDEMIEILSNYLDQNAAMERKS
jgi:hypothetical protein